MHVTLIAAQSIDGFITRHDDPGTSFTSAADKRYFAQVLAGFDCSIMGRSTYDVWQRERGSAPLTAGRRRIVLTRQPERYAAATQPGALEFSDEPPGPLLDRLGTLGHRRCALLGGGGIHHLFLVQNLVQELWLTLEPRLFGHGTPLVRGTIDCSLALLSVERLPESDSLLVKYAMQR